MPVTLGRSKDSVAIVGDDCSRRSPSMWWQIEMPVVLMTVANEESGFRTDLEPALTPAVPTREQVGQAVDWRKMIRLTAPPRSPPAPPSGLATNLIVGRPMREVGDVDFEARPPPPE